jgi:hypothetical protein
MGASNNGAAAGLLMSHEVEVMAKATRRRFSAEYKLKVLREAEAMSSLLRHGPRCSPGMSRGRRMVYPPHQRLPAYGANR